MHRPRPSSSTETTRRSTGRPRAAIRSASGAMMPSAAFSRQVGQQDDPDPGVRQGIAPKVVGEGVVAGLGRGHSNSVGLCNNEDTHGYSPIAMRSARRSIR